MKNKDKLFELEQKLAKTNECTANYLIKEQIKALKSKLQVQEDE